MKKLWIKIGMGIGLVVAFVMLLLHAKRNASKAGWQLIKSMNRMDPHVQALVKFTDVYEAELASTIKDVESAEREAIVRKFAKAFGG